MDKPLKFNCTPVIFNHKAEDNTNYRTVSIGEFTLFRPTKSELESLIPNGVGEIRTTEKGTQYRVGKARVSVEIITNGNICRLIAVGDAEPEAGADLFA